jgi:hypothetical protein
VQPRGLPAHHCLTCNFSLSTVSSFFSARPWCGFGLLASVQRCRARDAGTVTKSPFSCAPIYPFDCSHPSLGADSSPVAVTWRVVRSPPSLTFLHTPPAFDERAASTAEFIIVPSGTTVTTLLPRVLDAASGVLLWTLPPTSRTLLQLTGLTPGVNYTLSVGCVDAAGNPCAQNVTYTWGSAGCPAPSVDVVSNLRSQSVQPGVRAFVWTPVPLATSYEYTVDSGDSGGSAAVWIPVPSWPPGTLPLLMVGVVCHVRIAD